MERYTKHLHPIQIETRSIVTKKVTILKLRQLWHWRYLSLGTEKKTNVVINSSDFCTFPHLSSPLFQIPVHLLLKEFGTEEKRGVEMYHIFGHILPYTGP